MLNLSVDVRNYGDAFGSQLSAISDRPSAKPSGLIAEC